MLCVVVVQYFCRRGFRIFSTRLILTIHEKQSWFETVCAFRFISVGGLTIGNLRDMRSLGRPCLSVSEKIEAPMDGQRRQVWTIVSPGSSPPVDIFET